MDRTRVRISAVLASLLFGAGYGIVVAIPGGGDVTEKTITDFYASDGRQLTAMLLYFVLVAGCLALVWFFNELRAQLPEGALSRTASQVSLAGVTAVAAGAGILAGPAGAQLNSDFASVGVPAAEAFAQAGLGVMLGFGMYALALSTVLFSLAARRANVVSGWLSLFGVAAGVVMLGSFIWLPGVIFPVWVLAVGIAGTRQPDVRRAPNTIATEYRVAGAE